MMTYVASRATPELAAMWRRLRSDGFQITSSWIDEGEPSSFTELWVRIGREVRASDKLVFYARPDDFPFKGALVEVGMALALGIPVVACLPGVVLRGRAFKPVGSWIRHPMVVREDDVVKAMKFRVPMREAAE